MDLGCSSQTRWRSWASGSGTPWCWMPGWFVWPGTASPAGPSTTASVPTWCWRLFGFCPPTLPSAAALAVATVQEEIAYTGGGARSSAFALEPDVALVVDVTFSTDVPDIEKKELGEHKIGGGPVLSRGSADHPVVFKRLVEAAEAEGISFTIQAAPKATRTDADGIHLVRMGVPTGLVSVPNRYMHSPNEIVSLGDLQSTAELLARFIRRLEADTDFTPR